MDRIDVINASRVSLRFEGRKRDEAPNRYNMVRSLTADVFLRLEDGSSRSVGEVDLDRVFLDAAPCEIWDWCDGQSAQLTEMYEEILRTPRLRNWLQNELILISDVMIQEEFRNRGIGTAALKKVLRRYARDCDAFAIAPYGSDRNGKHNYAKSKRLESFYGRLGFRMVTESFMLQGADASMQSLIEKAARSRRKSKRS